MSHGWVFVCVGARTSTQYSACNGGGERKEDGVMGGGVGGDWLLASNLQGLASNTIWRETIQFAGIREGREGGTDEEQEQRR